jgi:pimeloyl-ACP methyl ester carboxylesterase
VVALDEIVTRYARSGDAQIAYQVRGAGPGLVSLMGAIPGLAALEEPLSGAYWERQAGFSRVVVVDERGSGRSDPLPPGQSPSVDDQADDLVAVLDAAAIDRVFISTFHAGGAVGVAFAVRYPERTEGLFIVNGWARLITGNGYPYGMTQAFSDQLIEAQSDHLGPACSPRPGVQAGRVTRR